MLDFFLFRVVLFLEIFGLDGLFEHCGKYSRLGTRMVIKVKLTVLF